jgi:hypothetical protein
LVSYKVLSDDLAARHIDACPITLRLVRSNVSPPKRVGHGTAWLGLYRLSTAYGYAHDEGTSARLYDCESAYVKTSCFFEISYVSLLSYHGSMRELHGSTNATMRRPPRANQ